MSEYPGLADSPPHPSSRRHGSPPRGWPPANQEDYYRDYAHHAPANFPSMASAQSYEQNGVGMIRDWSRSGYVPPPPPERPPPPPPPPSDRISERVLPASAYMDDRYAQPPRTKFVAVDYNDDSWARTSAASAGYDYPSASAASAGYDRHQEMHTRDPPYYADSPRDARPPGPEHYYPPSASRSNGSHVMERHPPPPPSMEREPPGSRKRAALLRDAPPPSAATPYVPPHVAGYAMPPSRPGPDVASPIEDQTRTTVLEMRQEAAFIDRCSQEYADNLQHARRLLRDECHKLENDVDPDWVEVDQYKPIRVTKRILIPIFRHPHVNFVGKILGFKGANVHLISKKYKVQLAILGAGTTKDRQREQELLRTGDPRYAHFGGPPHIRVETSGPSFIAHMRMAAVLNLFHKLFTPGGKLEIDGHVIDDAPPWIQEQEKRNLHEAELSAEDVRKKPKMDKLAKEADAIEAEFLRTGDGSERGKLVSGNNGASQETPPRGTITPTRGGGAATRGRGGGFVPKRGGGAGAVPKSVTTIE